jgi:hypothetical protein
MSQQQLEAQRSAWPPLESTLTRVVDEYIGAAVGVAGHQVVGIAFECHESTVRGDRVSMAVAIPLLRARLPYLRIDCAWRAPTGRGALERRDAGPDALAYIARARKSRKPMARGGP